MSNVKYYKFFYFLIVFVVIITALLCAYIIFFKTAGRVPSQEGVQEITVQPSGPLENIPNEMVIYFIQAYPAAEGVIIDQDSLPSFIKIEPFLPADGKWTSNRTFEIYFREPPRPEQEYKITMVRIPLISEEAAVEPRVFGFTTPSFGVNNIALKDLGRKSAVISLDFNFAPERAGIKDYIMILDSRGKRVEISSVRTESDRPQEVLIVVPVLKAPEQYKVTVRKGLKSRLDVVLKQDFEAVLPVGFTARPISVTDYKVEESDDGYMVVFNIVSPAERPLEVKEENLGRFVRVSPEIKVRAATSSGKIYLFGSFIPEKTYKITLKSGIMSKKGSILQQTYTTEITTPAKKEKLQFVYRGRYFGRTGAWNIPLKVAKIKTVNLNIVYMPPENVIFWHLKDYGRKEAISSLGEAVVNEAKIDVEKGLKDQIVWLDLRQYLKDESKGVYLVQAYGHTEGGQYLNDRVAVVISDISLVVKWYRNSIYVWAFNSSLVRPEAGVEIEVKSSKNFLTGKGTTNNEGFCAIPVLKEGRDPFVVFARRGDEWTYVHVPSLRLPLEAYDVGGEYPGESYRAYMYPERDLYRPGDEVHLGALVRAQRTFEGVAMPVKLVVRDPQGRNFLSLAATTDAYGFCEFGFPTSVSSPTGKYMLSLVAGDQTLYWTQISVETFAPERMRVELGLPETPALYKSIPLAIDAQYLFGAPASGEEYSAKLKAEETDFTAPGYFNYSFGIVRRGERVPSWESDGQTGYLDDQGRAREVFRLDTNVVFNGPVRLSSYVTVSEGGSGRVTAKSVSKTVYTKPYYVGIHPNVSRVIDDVPVVVKGVMLKPDGSVNRGESRLYYKVYRLPYYYSYYDDYYENDYSWESRIEKIPVTERKYLDPVDGKFSFEFTPSTSYYDYLIEVVDEAHETRAQVQLSGWGWYYSEAEEKSESPEVLPLRLDKKDYDAGEDVKVQALLPFAGKILWTVELDTLYRHELRDARGDVASWSFRAPSGVSNVYVTGLLVRSGGNYLVQRGFGVQRVRIRPKDNRMNLEVLVPERVKPGEELILKVRAGRKFKGTIAVVDEGILQITNFASPEPYEGIFRDIALYINSAESFGWIMKRVLEKTGGGFASRDKEFAEARFARIVSYWSGIKESDNEGNIVYKLKIPQYNGKLRVMAVGADETRFGGRAASVYVRSDVIVAPTIPRFMHTNDRFSFPISLINTTKSTRSVKLGLTLKNCRAAGPDKRTVVLKPEEKQVVWIECTAGSEPGGLDIAVDASSDQESYHEDFVIPVYPNAPYVTESEYIKIKPNAKYDLKPLFDQWFPRAHTARLILTNVPALSRLNHVRYAIGYPYGCIEQTSTSTMVLLRLGTLLPVIAPDISKEKFTEMVNYGVRRIMSMQTISGGFTYWPGGNDDQPWAAAYATFVLLEAKDAGFGVPDGVIKAALNYLDAQSDKSGMAYYVLAKGKKLQKRPEAIDRLVTMARKEKYDLPNWLWVAGAIFESGRVEEARSVLGMALKQKPSDERHYSGDFYSRLQSRGMALYLVEDINPGMPEEDSLLVDIVGSLGLHSSYYYTTQELAWSMLGIGKYAGRLKKQDFSAELKLDGKAVAPQREKGMLSWELRNPGQAGTGRLEVKSGSELFLNIENTGFSRKKTSFVPYAKGITLERKLYDYDGNAVRTAAQGDLVVVRVEIKTDNYYDNVAVEVPIPAGLEIENPRIGRDDLPGWADSGDNLWWPDYVDIRDDRVIIFGRTHYDSRYYYFLARCVTPGEFFLAPVRGLVMYNPDLNAHTAAEVFTVNRP